MVTAFRRVVKQDLLVLAQCVCIACVYLRAYYWVVCDWSNYVPQSAVADITDDPAIKG